jgi:peroxiredoxin
MQTEAWITLLLLLAAALLFLAVRRGERRDIPALLRPGEPLPAFRAIDETDRERQSTELQGSPAVLIFVRGTWCPFCSSQVESLADVYREIAAMGARLVLIAPRPLATTRRVADYFDVEFEFWLDESLEIARKLGLLDSQGVPEEARTDFGADTVWPASIVVDANGMIRRTIIARDIADRPDPRALLKALQRITAAR